LKSSEQWQLADAAAMRYEDTVARYIVGPWACGLVEAAALRAGDRVLDVACGTGAVTRVAAGRVGPSGSVIGLDLNAAMLRVASSLSRASPVAIEWVERSAHALGLPDGSRDAVLCQQGLQFFPDRALAMREMRRVLDRGGRLALSVWKGSGVYNGAVRHALAEFMGEDAAARFGASRDVPSERDLRRLAIDAGFDEVRIHVCRREVRLPSVDRFVPDHLASTPIAAAWAEAGAQVHASVGARVKAQLSEFADAGGVSFPEEIHLLTGRA
jgi:ubiquinone/menaquinone biosynthesis C-methylase UbiE